MTAAALTPAQLLAEGREASALDLSTPAGYRRLRVCQLVIEQVPKGSSGGGCPASVRRARAAHALARPGAGAGSAACGLMMLAVRQRAPLWTRPCAIRGCSTHTPSATSRSQPRQHPAPPCGLPLTHKHRRRLRWHHSRTQSSSQWRRRVPNAWRGSAWLGASHPQLQLARRRCCRSRRMRTQAPQAQAAAATQGAHGTRAWPRHSPTRATAAPSRPRAGPERPPCARCWRSCVTAGSWQPTGSTRCGGLPRRQPSPRARFGRAARRERVHRHVASWQHSESLGGLPAAATPASHPAP